jgi:hypothetical protein
VATSSTHGELGFAAEAVKLITTAVQHTAGIVEKRMVVGFDACGLYVCLECNRHRVGG